MSRDRERLDEIRNKIKRETQMGRRHIFGPSAGTILNTITPCAACKLLRRRCAEECPFSPYFSPHEPHKFAAVHKVFGASNVSKLLMEVPEIQRADAANSLVYEANLRLRDPVYGCMGAISALQQQIQSLQAQLEAVRNELLKYRYREATSSNIISSSPADLVLYSIAAPPQSLCPPPPPTTPPPTSSPPFVVTSLSSTSVYTPPSTTGYSSILSGNVPYIN